MDFNHPYELPLHEVEEHMEVGIVTRRNTHLSRYGEAFIAAIRKHIPSSSVL